MNDMSIRDRYTTYLDASIIKEPYTPLEQQELARLFWVQGKSYPDLKFAFGNHGRGSIKKCLGIQARKGLRNLQLYLSKQISNLPQQMNLNKGFLKRYQLVNGICSQSSFKWQQYQYTYLLLYYFIVNEGPELDRIPKELAMILYKRLARMSLLKQKQKIRFYSKIDPSLYSYIQSNSESKRKGYMKNYRQSLSSQEWKQQVTHADMDISISGDSLFQSQIIQEESLHFSQLNMSVDDNNE